MGAGTFNFARKCFKPASISDYSFWCYLLKVRRKRDFPFLLYLDQVTQQNMKAKLYIFFQLTNPSWRGFLFFRQK